MLVVALRQPNMKFDRRFCSTPPFYTFRNFYRKTTQSCEKKIRCITLSIRVLDSLCKDMKNHKKEHFAVMSRLL